MYYTEIFQLKVRFWNFCHLGRYRSASNSKKSLPLSAPHVISYNNWILTFSLLFSFQKFLSKKFCAKILRPKIFKKSFKNYIIIIYESIKLIYTNASHNEIAFYMAIISRFQVLELNLKI